MTPPTANASGPATGLIRRLVGGDSLDAQAVRYVAVGAFVALVYTGLTIALTLLLLIPIEAAIAIAYTIAVTIHFLLQRTVVFSHVRDFALSWRRQAAAYVVIGLVQWALTSLGIVLLARWLGWPQIPAYLLTTAVVTVATFFVLRQRVFHGPKVPGD